MQALPLQNRFLSLGDRFYQKIRPTPVPAPGLIVFNDELARDMELPVNGADPEIAASLFSGNAVPDGAEPVAMAYAGHQFGHFVPQLGDGRALYIGEVIRPDGRFFDVHLKGTGRTRFSRGGDGRAALGPVLREYLVSEAMARLNVPTTRALAAVTTGEEVFRERPLPGGVLTRVASSFVRVGTFQFFAARGDEDAVRKLADYVIERNYPEIREAENPYLSLLKAVVERQAALIARWMELGFIHGVMNTDNMSVAGETIDYGPCAFMDEYNHHKVFSSIDHGGRYAYSSQPGIGLWNLSRFAETLLPLLEEDIDAAVRLAKEVLETYPAHFEKAWIAGFKAKCGITGGDDDEYEKDRAIVTALLDIMAAGHADFTLTFFHLSRTATESNENETALRGLFNEPAAIDGWLTGWRRRLQELGARNGADVAQRQGAMQQVNPVYIPRNHQVEAVIRAAEDRDDFSLFHELHAVLCRPFDVQEGKEQFMQPPRPEQVVRQTFCGT